MVLLLELIRWFVDFAVVSKFSIIHFEGLNNTVAQKSREFVGSANIREVVSANIRNDCLRRNMTLDEKTNPGAPISFMPSGAHMVIKTLTSFEGCKANVRNYRVLLILSRVESFELRSAIRNTYADFSKYSNGSLRGNWTRFFLLGWPQSANETEKLLAEISDHKDIVVTNTKDSSKERGSTIKYLVGLKIASCFCPDAEYLIRVDDDSYILVRQTEKVLHLAQKEVDSWPLRQLQQNGSEQQARAEHHVRFYTGFNCGMDEVYRSGFWALDPHEYPETKFPFNCKGVINILSMSAVHEMAVECPRHCIGQSYEHTQVRSNRSCLYGIDDVFIGSCVSITQRNKTKAIKLKPEWGVMLLKFYFNVTEQRNASGDLLAHGYKTSDDMERVHKYYYDRKLVY